MIDLVRGGKVTIGREAHDAPAGKLVAFSVSGPGPVVLGEGVVASKVILNPCALVPLFNGKDLEGWARIDLPNLPAERRPTWKVENGVLRTTGGPGALEHRDKFGDVLIQVKARTVAPYSNGGVFIRSVPGDRMNGYEAQIYNRCDDNDPARPIRYSSGALDDRQLARRLVSRDGEPFIMTILAVGPHLSVWVNGHHLTDWTDTRAMDSNPRKGLRLEPGTIQLQAHDPGTDIEFHSVAVGVVK
jgi:hypothetical protein